MTERLQQTAARLRSITEGCRDDMHEPDEDGLKCRVVGDHLDNAFGNRIDVRMIEMGCQEFVVVIERQMDYERRYERFNLADLIALARQHPGNS
jgi:hypothetical protein